MPAILIIDDDPAVREGLRETLADGKYEAVLAASGNEGLQLLRSRSIAAVLLDLRMPGLDGITVLGRIQSSLHPPPVTVLTAHATAANTIEAMRLGAFDHLTKPLGRNELLDVVARMLASKPFAAAESPRDVTDDLVGNSDAMRRLQKTIGLIADSDATVLITGETGTGKEVVARAIHRHGRRSSRAFTALNCAAIPSELLESELFGHTKGAFTGATSERLGAFREANLGTLFLDEIGDMDLAMQAKILRSLQERIVTPVGGKPVRIDVRVIAATHRDLAARVAEGAFREDLLYRLNVIPVQLPPVRERRDDIIPLAEYFLRGRQLTPDARDHLVAHDWPGNVREICNAMQRAMVLVRTDTISAKDLAFLDAEPPIASRPNERPGADLPGAVARLECDLIKRALEQSNGNRAEAARRLGIPRQQLYVKLKRYGLELSEMPTADASGADTSSGPDAQKP